jgi:hypothetical protein
MITFLGHLFNRGLVYSIKDTFDDLIIDRAFMTDQKSSQVLHWGVEDLRCDFLLFLLVNVDELIPLTSRKDAE